jgi:mRNA interferase MazF
MNLNPGEVWLADLGIAAKTRPVVIVSRHDLDPPRALAIYVPLTTQYRDSLYEVVLPRLRFLDRDSIANIQGMGSIPTVRLERKLGKLSDEVMLKIKQAILFTLDLEPNLPANQGSDVSKTN